MTTDEVLRQAIELVRARPDNAVHRGMIVTMNYTRQDHEETEGICERGDECSGLQLARKVIAGEY